MLWFLTSCSYKSKQDVIYFKRLAVPYIEQRDDYSCATTSAAMVISYYEHQMLDKDKVWLISGSNVQDVKNYGNDMDGLKKVADHYGYKSEFKENLSLTDLGKYISEDTPVIINLLQEVGLPYTHSVLVIGCNSKDKIFYLHDPAYTVVGERISYQALSKRWSSHLSKPRKLAVQSGFLVYRAR